MISKLLIAFGLAIVVLLIVIALRPNDFRYSRSATIAAPAAVLFEQVSDLHKFQNWNPWAKVDPNAKITFAGPTSGVGAAYSWAGNNDVGEGTMTAIESRPPELARFRMEFRKPMSGISTAEFTFKPDGDKTLVTWSMFGPNNFMGKAMGLFIDCDKMVGDQFAKGLVNLAEVAAKPN
ncbi:MAG: SRPBCC family protein [Luteolibacter sp.]